MRTLHALLRLLRRNLQEQVREPAGVRGQPDSWPPDTIYNVIGIPMAPGALYMVVGMMLSPIVASAAMVFSSVSSGSELG